MRALLGKNDGSVRGKRYFRCKKLHGSFVRPVTVKLLDSGGLVSSQFVKDKNASPSKIKQPERSACRVLFRLLRKAVPVGVQSAVRIARVYSDTDAYESVRDVED